MTHQPMFDVNTPVRLLLRANREFDELRNRLEANDRWKKLMQFLPRSLAVTDFNCGYDKKYTQDHVRLIEKAGSAEKTCSEYLIDEWGTSTNGEPGNFPRIGDLIRFLVGAGLYIPAVYLAIDLLNDESLIVRPSSGPAALVSTTLNEPASVDRLLTDIDYPQHFDNINDSVLNRNLDHPQVSNSRNISIPIALPEPQPTVQSLSASLGIPPLDSLLGPNSKRLSSDPMSTELTASSLSASSEQISEPSFNIPNIEALNEQLIQNSEPMLLNAELNYQNSESIIPNVSLLANDA